MPSCPSTSAFIRQHLLSSVLALAWWRLPFAIGLLTSIAGDGGPHRRSSSARMPSSLLDFPLSLLLCSTSFALARAERLPTPGLIPTFFFPGSVRSTHLSPTRLRSYFSISPSLCLFIAAAFSCVSEAQKQKRA